LPWLFSALEAGILGFWFRPPGRRGQAPTQAAPHRCHAGNSVVAVALRATVRLIDDLINGSAVTDDRARLLAAGALVWLGNNLSFSLLIG